MRKTDFVNKKFVVRTIASVMTIVVATASIYGYTTFAGLEDVDTEGTQTEVNLNDSSKLEDTISNIVSISEKEIGKDETVYIIADNTGKATSTIVSEHLKNANGDEVITDKSDLENIENVNGDETFTQDGEEIKWQAQGNDIYYQGTTTKKAPINVKITYFLDGKEMSAEEIAGKSGKVTIRFDYTNNEKETVQINGTDEEMYVPFIAVSGMLLNDDFKNVEVTNGKLISDGQNQVVVGMAMPGMKDNLKLDEESEVEIPEYVEMTADVENFNIDMTLTVAMCNEGVEVSDIDLTEMDSKVDEISDATNMLEDGSNQLADGLDEMNKNMPEFKSGMVTLKNGIIQYTDGAKKLNSGIVKLYKSSGKLVKGMKSVKTAVDAIYDNFGTKDKKDSIRGGAKELADGSDTLNSGVSQLAAGAQTLATGSSTVTSNLNTLSQGITQISGQVSVLNTSMEKIDEGAAQVSSGVETLANTIELLGSTIEKQETDIYTQLSALGIKTYDEAEKTLEEAKTLQTTIITAIAADTYTGLEAYGITDSVSGATVLKQTTTSVNKLTEAVASLKVMDNVAENVSSKKDDIEALKAGAKSVGEGVNKAATGVSSLKSALDMVDTNTQKLAVGAKSVSDGADTINSNMSTITNGTQNLKDGAETLDRGIETLYTKAISPLYKGTGTLYDSMPALKSGIKKLKSGSNKLVENNDTLKDGAAKLQSAAGTIGDGVGKLDDGANDLKDGMKEFNQQAVSKLVNSYNGDIKELVDRLNAAGSLAQKYTTFTKTADNVNGNVKFIIRTDEVKSDE